MENNKIIKIGAICVITYIGVNITCNVVRLIVKKIEEKREYEMERAQLDETIERMKKAQESNNMDDMMDALMGI